MLFIIFIYRSGVAGAILQADLGLKKKTFNLITHALPEKLIMKIKAKNVTEGPSQVVQSETKQIVSKTIAMKSGRQKKGCCSRFFKEGINQVTVVLLNIANLFGIIFFKFEKNS